jgi:hypothetical protein
LGRSVINVEAATSVGLRAADSARRSTSLIAVRPEPCG